MEMRTNIFCYIAVSFRYIYALKKKISFDRVNITFRYPENFIFSIQFISIVLCCVFTLAFQSQFRNKKLQIKTTTPTTSKINIRGRK